MITSALQERVEAALREIDPGLKREHEVHSLPVDIMLSTGVPVQIHGPTHYLKLEDGSYQTSTSDNFKSMIISHGCGGKPVVTIPFFEIPKGKGALKSYLQRKVGQVFRMNNSGSSLYPCLFADRSLMGAALDTSATNVTGKSMSPFGGM